MKQTIKSEIDRCYSDFLQSIKIQLSSNELSHSERDLKRIFKSTIGFSCLSTNILPIEIQSFAGVLNEGSLCLNHLFFQGFFTSGFALLRTIFETHLKVIYFSNHPVELKWTMERVGYKEINYSFLFEYLFKTDEARNLHSNILLNERITDNYALLSRYVHCHNPGFSQFSLLRNSKEYSSTLAQSAKVTYEVFSICTLLFGIFFKKNWTNVTPAEKSLALLAFKETDKKEFLRIQTNE